MQSDRNSHATVILVGVLCGSDVAPVDLIDLTSMKKKRTQSLLAELHGRSTLVLEQGVGRQLAVLEFWEQASSSAARSGKDAASCSCWEKLNQRHVMTSRR